MTTIQLTQDQVQVILDGGMVFHSTQTIEQFCKEQKIVANAKGQRIGKYAGKEGKLFLGYLTEGSTRPQFLAGKANERIERPVISFISVQKTDKDGTKLFNTDRTPVIDQKFLLHTEAKSAELVDEMGY